MNDNFTTRRSTACAIIAALGLASTSQANDVLSQPPSLGNPGWGIPSHDQHVAPNPLYHAENFQYAGTHSLAKVAWWGMNHGGNYQDLSNLTGFEIEIWSGAFFPSQLVHSQSFNLAQTNFLDTGIDSQHSGANIYSHEVTLSSLINIPPGETYFVAVIAKMTDTLDEWYWHQSITELMFGVGQYVHPLSEWGLAPVPFGRAMELTFVDSKPGTAFCFCDSSNSPCGNVGASGSGCANGSEAAGAVLEGSGLATLSADSLLLSASGLVPNTPGLFFQGNGTVNGGSGSVFGDGIRCAGGFVVRLGVVTADASGLSDTSGFSSAISVLGGVAAGDVKHYQLWYRDPSGSPCGAQFNLTNGYTVQW